MGILFLGWKVVVLAAAALPPLDFLLELDAGLCDVEALVARLRQPYGQILAFVSFQGLDGPIGERRLFWVQHFVSRVFLAWRFVVFAEDAVSPYDSPPYLPRAGPAVTSTLEGCLSRPLLAHLRRATVAASRALGFVLVKIRGRIEEFQLWAVRGAYSEELLRSINLKLKAAIRRDKLEW